MDGLFVTFEGTEGSGKTTQVQLLASRLSALNRQVLTLREPGGTPIGEEIRRVVKETPGDFPMCPETELLLLNASRAQLVRQVIRPALIEGKVVLCDRFIDSTIAYQVFGRGMDATQVQRILEISTGPTQPDLTVLLRVPLGVSEARRDDRSTKTAAECAVRDRFEEEDREFFRRVEQGYDSIAANVGPRVRSIDGTQSIEEVHAEIWRWVEPLLFVPPEQGERAWKTIGEYRTGGPG